MKINIIIVIGLIAIGITTFGYAKEHDMDLIVITTDGRDNLLEILSGTVSEQVINHAHCPTLVVPGEK